MYFLVVFVATLIQSFFEGLILKNLWVWFITPAFDLKPINIATAVGVSLILGLATVQPNNKDSYEDKEEMSREKKLASRFFMSSLYALFVFILGWIWHFFV